MDISNSKIDKFDDSHYGPKESRRILKNVILVSVSFSLLFTAFSSISALLSSLYPEGLGVYSLSTVYGSIVIASMFMPSLVIKRLTVKWTMVFSMCGYAVFMIVQFFPSYGSLIPAAVIVGISGSTLWSAKCKYMTVAANEYARINGLNPEVVMTRFFGIFFFIFQLKGVIGNLISSFVLSAGDSKSLQNSSQEHIGDFSRCGANFCPGDPVLDESSKPSDQTMYLLSGLLLASAICSIIVASFFVDPLIRYGEKTIVDSKKTGKELLIATFVQMKNPYQILLIPITVWSGVEQGFIGADFTQAYISCSWGVEKIGFIFLSYAIIDGFSSFGLGQLARYLNRIPVVISGGLLNFALLIGLVFWSPNPDDPILYFTFAGLWGLADSVWQTQINSLNSIVFDESVHEAAFSNYRVWESLGFIIAFIFNNFICMRLKLYFMGGFLTLGMTGYLILEMLIRNRKNYNK